MSMPLVGDACARELDGTWFDATVCFVNADDRSVNIKYNDDGNIETQIEFDSEEIRFDNNFLETYSDVEPTGYSKAGPEIVQETTCSNTKDAAFAPPISDSNAIVCNREETESAPTPVPKIDAVYSETVHLADEASLCRALSSVMHLFDSKQHITHPVMVNRASRNVYAPLAGRCNNRYCLKLTPYRCARCNVTFYCSKRCQKEHWETHLPICIETTRRDWKEQLLCFAKKDSHSL